MIQLLADRFRRPGLRSGSRPCSPMRARARRSELRQARVRHGDIYDPPIGDQAAAAGDPPGAAFPRRSGARGARAGALLTPGGRLLIVDFAQHELEFLRQEYAHAALASRR